MLFCYADKDRVDIQGIQWKFLENQSGHNKRAWYPKVSSLKNMISSTWGETSWEGSTGKNLNNFREIFPTFRIAILHVPKLAGSFQKLLNFSLNF